MAASRVTAARAPTRWPKKAFFYDGDGRLIAEQGASAFDGAGNPTPGQSWTTQYTPTGKVAARIDPSGCGTYFRYDGTDREGKALDSSGRQTSQARDLAGQLLVETRAKGFDLEQAYQTFTWWPDGERKSVTDANGNTTNLAYDGFNRLTTITFADHCTEQSQYDPDGDLTIWTNRGGFGIVRCWDADNRKVSERGYSNVANDNTACPSLAGATQNIATRAWDMPDRSFGYDLAGRLASASNSLLDLSYAYDAAGRPTARTTAGWSVGYTWDASGNLVQETYPDGSSFCFGYDAADRMTSAAKGACPGIALAAIGYDPLGRRSGITFGDNSTQTYQYLADDRLQTLAHAFPNDAADNVTLTYGYDDAGRELSRQYSNATYAWSATVGSTSYAAATNLNQYPSAAGLGRFLQPDPAGLDQGPNLYAYVLDDPVNRGDPLGLQSIESGWQAEYAQGQLMVTQGLAHGNFAEANRGILMQADAGIRSYVGGIVITGEALQTAVLGGAGLARAGVGAVAISAATGAAVNGTGAALSGQGAGQVASAALAGGVQGVATTAGGAAAGPSRMGAALGEGAAAYGSARATGAGPLASVVAGASAAVTGYVSRSPVIAGAAGGAVRTAAVSLGRDLTGAAAQTGAKSVACKPGGPC